jgi:hypothetical protein
VTVSTGFFSAAAGAAQPAQIETGILELYLLRLSPIVYMVIGERLRVVIVVYNMHKGIVDG